MASRTIRDTTSAEAQGDIAGRRKALAAGLSAEQQAAYEDAMHDPNAVRPIREGRALPVGIANPLLTNVLSMLKKAEALAIADERVMPYRKLLAYRAAAYAEIMKQIGLPPEIAEWASHMTMLTGKTTVPCWWNHLPWATALMVARYGEAPEMWPHVFDRDDVRRAREWMAGDLPEAIRFGVDVVREGVREG
jgi:hypothetical protein